MARVKISSSGTKEYLNDAAMTHREDGPAMIWQDGEKRWIRNGKWFCDDKNPSNIEANGDRWWYHNNRLVRYDGPVGEMPNGYKEWNDGGTDWPKL